MIDIELWLPFPPTVNSYYSVVGNRIGTKRISHRGRAFREAVLEGCVEQLGDRLITPIDYPMYCEVHLHPPDKRTRDLDNYMKALLDSLTQAGVWTDDSLIDQLVIYRGAHMLKGLCHITITEAGPVMPAPKLGETG